MVKCILMLTLAFLCSCTAVKESIDAQLEPVPSLDMVGVPVEEVPVTVRLVYMTSTESDILLNEIKEVFPKLDRAANDMEARFCPKYKSLTNTRKQIVWAYLANAIVQFESGHDGKRIKTCTKFDESNGDLSEGWFQLTYGNKFCPRKKSEGDLCDVKVNASCGVKLMAHFIHRAGIVTDGGYVAYGAKPPKGLAEYWSVARMPDKKSQHHLSAIMEKTKKAPGCL